MNTSLIYDKSVKLIDDSYERLVYLRTFPKGHVSRKTIKGKSYYYFQYRDKDKVVSKYINRHELQSYKDLVRDRDLMIKKNKEDIKTVEQNIRLLKIYDKNLSILLRDELESYHFDEMPLEYRKNLTIPLFSQNISEERFDKMKDELTLLIEKWIKGEIRAREISNFMIRKLSD